MIAALLAAVVGCHRSARTAPPCGAVGATLLIIAHAEIDRSNPDEGTRRALLDQLPAMRDSLVRACTDDHWSDALRTCQVNAATHAEFETCQLQLTDDQRRALAQSGTW